VDELPEITSAELAEHDGRGGRRAYIAHEGKVYDVTDSGYWADGDHLGAHRAGADLTAELAAAPHGSDHLDNVKLVGRLAA
jgi:predicted heme/steroid binding protein